jgi:hypothetical protein
MADRFTDSVTTAENLPQTSMRKSMLGARIELAPHKVGRDFKSSPTYIEAGNNSRSTGAPWSALAPLGPPAVTESVTPPTRIKSAIWRFIERLESAAKDVTE